MKDRKKIVIALGGSMVVPDDIDTVFLKRFREHIKKQVIEEGKQFFLIIGGGKVCRRYQVALVDMVGDSEDLCNWIGIYTTRLNAQFVRLSFGDLAHSEIVLDPTDKGIASIEAPVIVGAGFNPGRSTDYNAIEIAKTIGAKQVVNFSNVDHVYDKDPKKYPDAKALEELSWEEYRKLIPEKFTPGLSSPFDPVASKNAQEAGIEVGIVDGSDLANLENYLEGKPFEGTILR